MWTAAETDRSVTQLPPPTAHRPRPYGTVHPEWMKRRADWEYAKKVHSESCLPNSEPISERGQPPVNGRHGSPASVPDPTSITGNLRRKIRLHDSKDGVRPPAFPGSWVRRDTVPGGGRDRRRSFWRIVTVRAFPQETAAEGPAPAQAEGPSHNS